MIRLDRKTPRYYHRDGSFFTTNPDIWATSSDSRITPICDDTPVGRYLVRTEWLGGVDFNVLPTVGNPQPLLFETVLFHRGVDGKPLGFIHGIKHITEYDALFYHTRIAAYLQTEFALS